MGELLALLEDWLVDRPDLRRMFAVWIRATLMRRAEYRILLPQVDDLQELRVMLAERLEQWADAYRAEGEAKGKAEGKAEGRTEGEALALQKLLSRRFGVVPAAVLEQISNAPIEQIDSWLDRVLDARSLDELFGPTACG